MMRLSWFNRRQRKRHQLITLVLFALLVPTLFLLRPTALSYIIGDPIFDIDVAEYRRDYQMSCERLSFLQMPAKQTQMCPCLSTAPIGNLDIATWYDYITEANTKGSRIVYPRLMERPSPVQKGGCWHPSHCTARQRVAIIVPFRKRHKHLRMFTHYMHAFLQRQLLHYALFVIEQARPTIFNRAALMNIGFLEVNRLHPDGFDCYIFHDIDLVPEDDRNMYTCFMAPVHLGAYMNKFNYRMPYATFFGGALGLTGAQVRAINGFPNTYYGWGGEDDETFNRIRLDNLTIQRYPQVVGRSFMFPHEGDSDNPINPLRWDGHVVEGRDHYQNDGLSSVQYEVTNISLADKYTMVTANIKPIYLRKCIINAELSPTNPNNYLDCLTLDNFRYGTIQCCRKNDVTYCCDNGAIFRFYRRVLIILLISMVSVGIPVIHLWRKKRFDIMGSKRMS